MDSMTQLEAPVSALETSLRRGHLLAFVLGMAVVFIVGAAQVPEAQEMVTTERLVLTNGPDSIVLVAGPESSLVIETPAGEEVLQLGGLSLRRIKR